MIDSTAGNPWKYLELRFSITKSATKGAENRGNYPTQGLNISLEAPAVGKG